LGGVATFTFPGGSEILVPAYGTKIITVAVDTTNAGTLVAGDLGVIGFGTMNAKGAGSGNTVLETVTGTVITSTASHGSPAVNPAVGDIVYFTKNSATGNLVPGYYMLTTDGNAALTATGNSFNGTAATFTATDNVVMLSSTPDVVNTTLTNSYAIGDIVYIYQSASVNGFYVVTKATTGGSTNVTVANALVEGITLVDTNRVTKLTNANALFSNTMQFEQVKPVISKNASSPSGTTSGSSEQIVAMFDVKAEGQRDLTFSALTLEKGGNNDPAKNVSKFYLYNGGTKLAQVDSTTVAGDTNAAVSASTVTIMEATSDGANKIGLISADEYATWRVGDTLTITDGTNTSIVTITTLPTYKPAGVSVVFSGTVTLDASKTITIYNNRVHFDGNATGQSLAAQTITAGQTMTLTVKADTQNVKTGANSGQIVNFTMSVPGSTGPLTTTPGGLTWTYTRLGTAGANYTGSQSDSYPVNANTLNY